MSPEFYKYLGPISFKKILSSIDVLNYDNSLEDIDFQFFQGIDNSAKGDLTFISNNGDYNTFNLKAKAVLISNKRIVNNLEKKINFIIVNDVHNAVAVISNLFYRELNQLEKNNLKKSSIGKFSEISENSKIKNGCIIGDHFKLDEGAVISESCIIGNNVKIGHNSVIQNAIIGDNVCIETNCSIGQPGFGFAFNESSNNKIFHKGRVIIQDNSHIGSNCTIDRGSFSDTIIGENVYLDNQVHIAHNVIIGSNSMIAGQVGIAGSTKIGNYVRIGGQVGIIGHVNIGDNVEIAAKSGVRNNIKSNLRVMGDPAINMFAYLKKTIKKINDK